MEGYRQTLRRALIERCQKNPKYSLRAFARDLELEPARLSDILNGKKGISRDVARDLARRLGLSARESESFCDHAESLHARSRVAREAARKRLKAAKPSGAASGHNLSIDTFHVVADWYHLAILQLLKLKTRGHDASAIAAALGIKPLQAADALERLQRLELVESRDGRLVPVDDYVIGPDGIPSNAVRKFHEQVLQRALAAIYLQPLEERDLHTTLMPVSQTDLPRARERIREFAQSFCEEFSESPAADRVYSLSIQFVNQTSNPKENES